MILYWGGATYKIVKVNLGRGLQQPRKGVGAKLLGLHELVGRDRGSENNVLPKNPKDLRN